MKAKFKAIPRPRLTIGAKLLALISCLLICAVLTVAYVSSQLFVQDNTALIQQLNSDSASHVAGALRNELVAASDKVRVLGSILSKDYLSAEVRGPVTKEFFAKDKEFLGVVVYSIDPESKSSFKTSAVSAEMVAMGDDKGEKAIESNPEFSPVSLASGEIAVSSIKLVDGTNAILLGMPYAKIQTTSGPRVEVLVGILAESKLLKDFADSSLVTLMLVDGKGGLIAHTDPRFARRRPNFSGLVPVKKMLEGKVSNGLSRYHDPFANEAKLGAFHTVGYGSLGVIAEVPEAKAFEAAFRAEYRTAVIAILMLAIAIALGVLYSDTITWPIKMLVSASKKISAGNFKIDLKPKGKDEIAHLSLAFNDMAKGLEERDKAKSVLNKFHNKEIAEKLLHGEIKLGGERKEAIIFFSDIRDFTAISEKLEPEQVVEMINEYMTRMVSIIRKHGGIVDKYVGDAIMALWGVPESKPHDLEQAVRACIEMRKELSLLNDVRMARGQGSIKIGMGLNVGQVIAGNIGSDEKMEYTVIGDSVNLASRIESMTKEYGTDLLISSSIADRVPGKFMLEECASVKVKGKTEAVRIFKVPGFIDEAGLEVIVKTPYSEYEKSHSDKRAA